MALIPAAANRFRPARGFVGTWANMEEDNARTGFAESEFVAGVPLMKGTGEMGVAPLVTANRFIGIALANVDMTGTPTSTGIPKFGIGELLGVADMGVVFVAAGGTVTAGQTPFYDPADGKYYGTTDTGRLPLPTCEFDENGTDGQPTALRIRVLPGAANVTAAS